MIHPVCFDPYLPCFRALFWFLDHLAALRAMILSTFLTLGLSL